MQHYGNEVTAQFQTAEYGHGGWDTHELEAKGHSPLIWCHGGPCGTETSNCLCDDLLKDFLDQWVSHVFGVQRNLEFVIKPDVKLKVLFLSIEAWEIKDTLLFRFNCIVNRLAISLLITGASHWSINPPELIDRKTCRILHNLVWYSSHGSQLNYSLWE